MQGKTDNGIFISSQTFQISLFGDRECIDAVPFVLRKIIKEIVCVAS